MDLGLFATLCIGLSAAMATAWMVQRLTHQSGWIDTIWSLSVGVFSLGVVLGHGHDLRHFIVAGLICLWAGRLGLHIAQRTKGAGDDPRYADLERQWGPNAARNLFWFLQGQAAAGVVLVLCVHLAAQRTVGFADSGFGAVQDILGAFIIILAILGEGLADFQMARFVKQFRGQNRVCDTGLWALSRHPNYFFEWLMWCGWAFMGLSFGLTGILALLAPVMIYWLLVHVSGIPPLEKHMMASRPEAFAAYCARVSPFFPKWPKS